jgi:hypothetical protein
MVDFARALPRLRRRVLRVLRSDGEPDVERVLAGALRLLDVGLFGGYSEQSSDDERRVALATVLTKTSRVDGAPRLPPKGGIRRVQAVRDPLVELLAALKRRRSAEDQLLAYREGRRWHDRPSRSTTTSRDSSATHHR